MTKTKKDSKVVKKPKLKKKLSMVKIFLNAGFNNSIISLTDMEGKVIAWSSSGKKGFKGSRKSTPFASQSATEEILEKIQELGATSAHILIKGAGMGRDSFIRTIQATSLVIESINDLTGFPFGGVRKKQQRKG
jgi:small subunit ribosomal protein S11